MEVLIPLVAFAALGAILLAVVTRRLESDERAWLLRLLLMAFALRLLVATMFEVFPSTRIFHEDAEGYEVFGLAIARGWRGEGPGIGNALSMDQNYGYPYLAAVAYFFFPFRVAASYFNGLIGTFIVYSVYQLTRLVFHRAVARRTALLTALVPSMILWSSLAIKDAPVTLLIIIALSSCVRLKQRFSVTDVFGCVLPVVAIQPMRFYIIYFLAFAIGVSLILDRGVRMRNGVSKALLLGGAAVGMLVLAGTVHRVEDAFGLMTFEHAASFRYGMATTAQSGFATEADISTPAKALMFLPTGVAMLLLSPFPWQFTSLRAALTAPEMIVWWMLIPGLIRGLRYATKRCFSATSPMLVFTVILTAAYSLIQGNVGSGFRQRAQIFVFLFIFTAVGQFAKRCRQAGIDEGQLLVGAEAEKAAA